MATYRLWVNLTYNNNSSATTATTNINSALTAQGRPEQADRTNRDVSLLIEGITEADAQSLLAALNSAWPVNSRTAGAVSCERVDS